MHGVLLLKKTSRCKGPDTECSGDTKCLAAKSQDQKCFPNVLMVEYFKCGIFCVQDLLHPDLYAAGHNVSGPMIYGPFVSGLFVDTLHSTHDVLLIAHPVLSRLCTVHTMPCTVPCTVHTLPSHCPAQCTVHSAHPSATRHSVFNAQCTPLPCTGLDSVHPAVNSIHLSLHNTLPHTNKFSALHILSYHCLEHSTRCPYIVQTQCLVLTLLIHFPAHLPKYSTVYIHCCTSCSYIAMHNTPLSL